jgi:hypothetical protein
MYEICTVCSHKPSIRALNVWNENRVGLFRQYVYAYSLILSFSPDTVDTVKETLSLGMFEYNV